MLSEPRRARRGITAVVLLTIIATYQRWLSPLLGNHCRFAPTCSHYASEAITQFGALRGTWMALRRLLRCHPFNAGGWDPVTR